VTLEKFTLEMVLQELDLQLATTCHQAIGSEAERGGLSHVQSASMSTLQQPTHVKRVELNCRKGYCIVEDLNGR
jgi:hypothetical protein